MVTEKGLIKMMIDPVSTETVTRLFQQVLAGDLIDMVKIK